MPDLAARLRSALEDRYTIEVEIGRGGMATVFLAHDRKHHRQVALKVLRPELAAMEPERFLREIELLASLRHPHILPLYDSGISDGLLYYVMPFVEGESLADRLAGQIQLPVDDALKIATEVADALAYAHERGVVHRDVKPDNIMLEGGHAVVADFGIAWAIDEAVETRLTRTGVSIGTPQYMSPEQATGESRVDARADVYALGAVLYEMLGGEPPHTGPTTQVVFAKALTDPVPSVRRIRSAVPDEVDAAIRTALAPTPADRYQTMTAFAEALEAARRGDPSRRHTSKAREVMQVLGLYVLASAAVLFATAMLTSTVGLPDWVQPFALGLLVVGLPIILATALVQSGRGGDGPLGEEGTGAEVSGAGLPNLSAGTSSLDRPSTRPTALRRLLTWKRALVGGVLAFAGLGLLTAGYMTMWVTGIGPVGNLVAQGVLEEGGRVVLATFDDATGEDLGNVVTEALRIDLLQASVLNLVESADVEPVLMRMEVPNGTPLTAELAREVAQREGVPAVIDGEVAAAGTGYILTATIRASDTGRSLAAFRATAAGPDEVIESIEALSRDIREKSGESLRSIRAGPPLPQVTTHSLDALKLYTEGVARNEAGDLSGSAEVLDQALARDSTFAMAWRLQGINTSADPDRWVVAYTNAFRYRERLPPLERHLVSAIYYNAVRQDQAQAMEAYRSALRVDPHHPSALNNLGERYRWQGDMDAARELYARSVDGPRPHAVPYGNLVRTLIWLGRLEEARERLAGFATSYPGHSRLPHLTYEIAFAAGDLEAAAAVVAERIGDPSGTPRPIEAEMGARLAHWTGHLDEARRLYLRAETLAAPQGDAATWSQRRTTAYEVSLVGDEAWARAHFEQGLEDAFATLPPISRNHVSTALELAMVGAASAAEYVIRDWETSIAEERRGPTATAGMAQATLYIRAQRGDRVDAEAAFSRLFVETGCSDLCWPFERARVHDWLGQPQRAIELYERVLGFGYAERYNVGQRLHAQLRLGPLYQQVGDTVRALEAYRRMADQWADGDPRGLERVREMEGRIRALGW